MHLLVKGVKIFEENGGLAGLETLEYNDNERLRTQADNILDTYFYKEPPVIDTDANVCVMQF
jgi:hypothetical protein